MIKDWEAKIQVAPRHQRNFMRAVQLSYMSSGQSIGVAFAKGNRILHVVGMSEYLAMPTDPLQLILWQGPKIPKACTVYVARQLKGFLLCSRPIGEAMDEMYEKEMAAVVFLSEQNNVVRQKVE